MRIKLPLLFVLLLLSVSLAVSGPARGAGPSDAFFEADACAREVRKSPQKQKSRASWTACIDRFQAVYRQDPRGPWAPASLFNSGTLYADLARTAGGEADRKAAIEQLELLQKRFPDSGYRDRAGAELQRLTAAGPGRDAACRPRRSRAGRRSRRRPSRSASPPTRRRRRPRPQAPREPLAKADACYRKLQAQPADRGDAARVDALHRPVPQHLPGGPLRPCGRARRSTRRGCSTSRCTRRSSSTRTCASRARTSRRSPRSTRPASSPPRPRGRSRPCRGPGPRPRPPRAGRPRPPSRACRAATRAGGRRRSSRRTAAAPAEDGLAVVQDLKYWSNPDYSRVVVYLDRDVPFTHTMLKRDPSIDKPPRLMVDVADATIGGGSQRTVPINDNLLSAARAARYTLDSVRVVVDIKSFETYKVFSLNDPFRIVIDVWGRGAPGALETAREPQRPGRGRAGPGRDPGHRPQDAARGARQAAGARRAAHRGGPRPRGQGLRRAGLHPGRAREGRRARDLQAGGPPHPGGPRPRGRHDAHRRPLPDPRGAHGLRQHAQRRPLRLRPHQRLARPARLRHGDLLPQPGDRRRVHPRRRHGERDLHQEHQRPALDPERPAQERQDQRVEPAGGLRAGLARQEPQPQGLRPDQGQGRQAGALLRAARGAHALDPGGDRPSSATSRSAGG
ncbi:MAG: AMIN domain-containing protein [Desulfomicrobium escambiense]|nr:AMIN domain-containing protein [Desulfomicrobium escambiense]